jgi:hypothetical protein
MQVSSNVPIGTPMMPPMINGATLRQSNACRSFQML